MIKRHFFLVAAAILLGLMVLAAVLKLAFAEDEGAGGPGGGGRRGGQQVSEAVVAQKPFSDQIRVLGVARGQRSVNITSSTTELITRVLFTDGQRVSAGAPLVELQAREEDAAIIEARANVAQAQREYDRYKALADRGVAPASAPAPVPDPLHMASRLEQQGMLAKSIARRLLENWELRASEKTKTRLVHLHQEAGWR